LGAGRPASGVYRGRRPGAEPDQRDGQPDRCVQSAGRGMGDVMNTSTAIVTGASSGIGLELAKVLARNGHDLALVAPPADLLASPTRELRGQLGVHVESYPCDLSDPAAVRDLCGDIEKSGVQIDILVNNAGMGLQGPFSEQGVDAINRVI